MNIDIFVNIAKYKILKIPDYSGILVFTCLHKNVKYLDVNVINISLEGSVHGYQKTHNTNNFRISDTSKPILTLIFRMIDVS